MTGSDDDQPDVLGQWLATRRTPGSATADTLRGRVRGSGPSALESRRSGADALVPDEEPEQRAYAEPVATSEPVVPDPGVPDPGAPEPVIPDPAAPEPIAPEPISPDPFLPDPVEPDPVPAEPAPGTPGAAAVREHVAEDVLAALGVTPSVTPDGPHVEARPRTAGGHRKDRRPAREPKPAREPSAPRQRVEKPARQPRPAKPPKSAKPPKPPKAARTPKPAKEKPAAVPGTISGQPEAPAASASWSHPLAPALLNGPVTHPDVHFRTRRGAQRLAGVLLLSSAAATCLAGWTAYQDRSVTNLGVLAILAVLSVVMWALRISSAPVTLQVVSGILEIEDGGKHYSWDLRSPHTPIEVHGRPGRRWRVWLHRPNASTYVVTSSVVNPRAFMRVLRSYRPEL